MPKRHYKPLMHLSKRQRNRTISDYLMVSTSNNISEPVHHTTQVESGIKITNNVTVASYAIDETNVIENELNNVANPLYMSADSDRTFSLVSLLASPVNSHDKPYMVEEETSDTFTNKLAAWAKQANIGLSRLNELLDLLKEHTCFNSLPRDSRTLLHTPRTYPNAIRPVKPGHYYHFGIENGICEILKKRNLIQNIPRILTLQISIDGLPIAKSSGSQFWPILGAIPEIVNTPFIIAVYHGMHKPECSNAYLEEFVMECSSLLTNGIIFQDKIFTIKISAFICDAPARSFIKKIKSHTGYFGCDKCVQKGSYIDNRTIFPEIDATLRTHEKFINQEQEEHHIGTSILQNIKGIDMVNTFPHDYMHLVCLGAMRKLLLLWMRGKLPVRLPGTQIDEVSHKLIQLNNVIPSEFARKPRSLRDIDRWKATEFRQLLLYTGPLVLKHIKKKYYTHFLALSCAIRIVAKDEVTNVEISVGQELVQYFLLHYSDLYGAEQISYNVHSLIHLVNDVKNLGNVDGFSAFKFENYLQKIKKQIRKSAMPLQQLIRRELEDIKVGQRYMKQSEKVFPFPAETHFDGPLVTGTSNPQYKKLIFEKFVISLSERNNCVILQNGTICIVENIATYQENIVIIGREFSHVKDYFMNPYPSSKIGIFKASYLSQTRKVFDSGMIKSKGLKIPLSENNYYVALMLHH